MRKLSFTLVILFLLTASCQTNNQAPTTATIPATAVVLTEAPAIPLAPTATIMPVKQETIMAYGCQHTGIVFHGVTPLDFKCNLESQMAVFTLPDGDVLSVGLYALPEPVPAGHPVTITTYAYTNSGEWSCDLTDSQTGEPLEATFSPQTDLAVHSDCKVGSILITMAYTVRVIPTACVPIIIWESLTPANFTLDPGKTYIVEARFPSVTGDDAWWAHEISWVEISPTVPLTFTGTIGKVYEFQGACSQMERQDWETNNLHSTPNQMENFIHAGVVNR